MSEERKAGRSPDALAGYDVTWGAPGRDARDSMPAGNGDLGINAWVERSGDLLLYIAKTDAWDGTGELLKLGRVRFRFTPGLAGAPFEQRLVLREGTITVKAGRGRARLEARVWVDANQPVIHVEARSAAPFTVEAGPEFWRARDRLLPGAGDGLAWCHRNETSDFAARLEAHNLGGFEKSCPDPLRDRTFGCLMRGDGLVPADDGRALCSLRPLERLDIQIHALTAQTARLEDWRRALEAQALDYRAVPLEARRREHRKWWRGFWRRSWIFVETPARETLGPAGAVTEPVVALAAPGMIAVAGDLAALDGPAVTPTGMPLRFGAGEDGRHAFRGVLGRARIFNRPLDAGEIAALARDIDARPGEPAGLVGDWRFDRLTAGVVPDLSGAGRDARPNRPVTFVARRKITGARLTGEQWFETADGEALDRLESLTIDAWFAPGAAGEFPARLVSKGRPAARDGYTLELGAGGRLRLRLKAGIITVAPERARHGWTHVAAVFDAARGRLDLYVNGRPECFSHVPVGARLAEGHLVSRAWILQRFINACAGRGVYPIKFNGSLFCVDWAEKDSAGNPDARRWGPDYWWQNTRLPYWAMLASGDYDLMAPLFRMYLSCLPLHRERTRRYFGHGGACCPETMSFWGLPRDRDYGTGQERAGRPIGWQANGYVRRCWIGGLELLWLMLNYDDHAGDRDFARRAIVPFAVEILAFYDEHYPRDRAGRLSIEPAQALETWWECVNPMPEVAGLTRVLPRLLVLPAGAVPAAEQARWRRMLGQLPALPVRGRGERRRLAPAQRFAARHNVENPELYAVFPFRLYGVGLPDPAPARAAMRARRHRMSHGWCQDDIQAACLGLAGEARRGVVRRAALGYPDARFPAFWGPNFDWIPDQDHGANLQTALQAMLMQCDGGRILLFPAWPKHWDVDFKLHAPGATTVRGACRSGRLVELEIRPARRRRDVTVMLGGP